MLIKMFILQEEVSCLSRLPILNENENLPSFIMLDRRAGDTLSAFLASRKNVGLL